MPAPPSKSANTDRGGASTGVSGGGFSAAQFGGAPKTSAPAAKGGGVASPKGPGASQAAAKATAQKQQAPQKQSVARSVPGTSAAAAKNTALGKAAQAASKNVRPSGTSTQFGGPQLSPKPGYSFSQSQNNARMAAISRGPGVVSGALPGNTNALAQRRTLTAFGNSIAENPAFNARYSPGALNMLPKAVIGEAQHEGDVGRAAVANVMMNRLALGRADPSSYGYLGAGSIPRMMRGIDAAGVDPNRPGLRPNAGYRNTRPGTEAYADGLRAVADSMSPYSQFSQTATPRTLNATHYYNDAISNPKWGEARSGVPFDRVGNHVFGNAERTAGQVADIRSGGLPAPTQFASAAIGSIPRPTPRPSDLRPAIPRPNPRPLQSFISGDPRASMPLGAFPAARLQSPVMGDPRANMAPGSYPAAPVRFAPPSDPRVGMPPGSYPAARMQSPVMGDPRVGMPPGAFPAKPASVFADPRVGMPVGGYPQAKPISIVATDPRVNMQPGAYFNKDQSRVPATMAPIAPQMVRPEAVGSYPVAQMQSPVVTDPRVNMPPGSYPAAPRMSPFGNVGQEYHQHTAPPTPSQYRNEMPPAAPNMGTPGSQTATLDDGQQQGWGSWIKDKTGVDVEKVATDIVDGNKKIGDAIEQHGVEGVQTWVDQKTGMGIPQSLRGYGEGSNDNALRSAQNAGFGVMQNAPASSGGGAEPQLSPEQLTTLLANMQAAGATPEEIAYVQSLMTPTA
jgi:hypothetical protein